MTKMLCIYSLDTISLTKVY